MRARLPGPVDVVPFGSPQLPRARVYTLSTQSIAGDSAYYVINFGSENYVVGVGHSTVTNTGRLVIQTAGLYMLGGVINISILGTSFANFAIRLNGTTVLSGRASNVAGLNNECHTETLALLAVDDYVEIIVAHNKGSAKSLAAGGTAGSWHEGAFWCSFLGSP